MEEAAKEREHLEPWLADGSVILSVQGKLFRVHSSVLSSYSEVFKDMFSIPYSSAGEEVIDGCPVIPLHDEVADVEIMLKALYDRSYYFFPDTPMPVSVLSAFLRMGKKYGVRQLFAEGRKRVSFFTPSLARVSTISASQSVVMFPHISDSDPFNFMVMNIACEVGLLSTVLVAAFYCCVACPSLSVTDGYEFNDVRCELSPPAKRYCYLVQRYVAEAEKQLFQCITSPASNCLQSSTRNACNSALLSIIRYFQIIRTPFAGWVDGLDSGLCVHCRAEVRKKHEEARARLWKNLPVELCLGDWENVDSDAEVA